MKDKRLYIAIIFLLSLVLVSVIYYNQNNESDAQKRLKREISNLEKLIDTTLVDIKVLKIRISKKDSVIDSLENNMLATKEELEKKQKALNYYAKKFKNLTDSDRDSILRAYVRANQ